MTGAISDRRQGDGLGEIGGAFKILNSNYLIVAPFYQNKPFTAAPGRIDPEQSQSALDQNWREAPKRPSDPPPAKACARMTQLSRAKSDPAASSRNPTAGFRITCHIPLVLEQTLPGLPSIPGPINKRPTSF